MGDNHQRKSGNECGYEGMGGCEDVQLKWHLERRKEKKRKRKGPG